MDAADTGNAIVSAVLGGKLPDEAHHAMVDRFWDLYPQFEHMRGVVEGVVADRRVTASLHAVKIKNIEERYAAESVAMWDEVLATIHDGFDGSQQALDLCQKKVDDAKRRSKEILASEIAEIAMAYRDDTDDFKRCLRFLVWHHERESLKSIPRCA